MESQFMDGPLLSAALRYAELGFHVFPLARMAKVPRRGSRGFLEATNHPTIIRDLWTHFPQSNIGIATAGLMVIDIDPGATWQDEPDSRLALSMAGGIQRTPRGGFHYVFKRPEGRSWRLSVGDIAPKVDSRTDGGYIVAAPSVLPTGRYSWELTLPMRDELPMVPELLGVMLDEAAAKKNRKHQIQPAASQPLLPQSEHPEGGGGEAPIKRYHADGRERRYLLTSELPRRQPAAPIDPTAIIEGERNKTLFSIGTSMRATGANREAIFRKLHEYNRDRCRPMLSANEVDVIADHAARYPTTKPFRSIEISSDEQRAGEMLKTPPRKAGGER
jgi:Bifunctional DNA primase/polymerase, N-terminal/Primase C terminal 1 (PriCT-1)